MTIGVIKRLAYIPKEDILDEDMLNRYFNVFNFNNSLCNKCPLRNGRTSCTRGILDQCYSCDGFLGIIKLWDTFISKNGDHYYTIPPANYKRIYKYLGIDITKYKDLRPCPKFKYDLKFIGKLRQGEIIDGIPSANQEKIVNDWLEKKYGFIQAPPRTGKTVIGVNISCRLGIKTIFIAHQLELLQNFYKSWLRDTNLNELREQTGKEIVKIIEKKKDFDEDLDVILCTYQSFIRATSDSYFEKYIKNKFGLAVIDEAHQSGALAYSKFVLKLDCKYKLGLSATPLRKDSLNEVMLNTIGPVTALSETTGLIPRIEILETGCNERSSSMWVYSMKRLFNNKDRNKLIIKEVFKDLKNHKCIIIPVDSITHMKLLVDSINNESDKEIAIGYYSGIKNRKQILESIDKGDYRVVVAIRSMIKQGIDLLSPSMIYIQIPMSAAKQPVGAPFFYQMGNRVATPYPGKREPIIKIFIDTMGESTGCFYSLFFNEILPGLKMIDGARPKYKIGKRTLDYIFKMTSNIKSKTYSQFGTYNPEYDKERPYCSKAKSATLFGWFDND